MIRPAFTLTPTELVIRDIDGLMGMPAWHALLSWLHFHGIDPSHLPGECTIQRDVLRKRVHFEVIVETTTTHHIARPAHVQLDGPPMPWPAELEGAARDAARR